MKVAISSDGENLQSNVCQRFEKCSHFLVVNIEEKEIGTFKSITNEELIQKNEVKIKAGEQIGKLKVNAVITGQLNSNTMKILKQLEIKAYTTSGTIKEALENFLNNKLKLISEVEKSNSETLGLKYDSNERIFFPLLSNKGINSEISQHFGHAPFFGLYDVEKKDLRILPNNLDHVNQNKSPIDQIKEAVNPTTIFAKGIGEKAIGFIQKKGLSLKTGNYTTIKEVIENLDKLDDQLKSCDHNH